MELSKFFQDLKNKSGNIKNTLVKYSQLFTQVQRQNTYKLTLTIKTKKYYG